MITGADVTLAVALVRAAFADVPDDGWETIEHAADDLSRTRRRSG